MNCVYSEEGGCRLGLPNGCRDCGEALASDDPDFPSRWVDGLTVTDRDRVRTDALRGLLAGRSAFLVGGGPSANRNDLSKLNRRGAFSFCVNNVAGHPAFRPQAFVCADPPSKFSHSIWLDPAIMKFVPTPKLLRSRGKLRRKTPDGSFVRIEERTADCPNVWGVQRQSWFTPDDRFFLDPGAMWGNLDSGVRRTGEKKTVNTSLLAIRILRYLGAKRIFLLGVDFHMQPDWGYSFAQGRTAGASESNNRQFAVVNEWLCKMQNDGVFRRFGLELYNTYRNSGLRAFPHVPFEEALADVIGMVEETPDLSAWYEKIDKEEK